VPDTDLINDLRAAVGRRYLLTGERRTERYRRGFRSGEGDAAAVVKPGTLLELWRVLEAAVRHDAIGNWVAMEQVAADLVRQGSVHGTLQRVPFSREAAVQESREGYIEDPGPDIWLAPIPSK
jgi:hypothetical protein